MARATFSLDVVTLVERGQIFAAMGYLLASVTASIFALAFGLLLMRNFA
jgi:fluoride ion exporter CrcB/FEX